MSTLAGARATGTTSRQFDFPALARVWYGRGSLEHLAEETERLGRRRVLLVSTPSTDAAVVARVRDLLGDRLAAEFADARAHVPLATVVSGTAVAREAGADLVVSVGGGSAVDCGKAVALTAPSDLDAAALLGAASIHGDATSGFSLPEQASAALPHLTVSTTLSAAEFTSTFTVTDEETRAKRMVHGRELTPTTAFLDADMTAATPSWLWASSGIRAVDHCVEWYLSRAATPFTDALVVRALRTLFAALRPSSAEPADLDARQECQVAAWMSVYGSANVLGGLSHAIGHQLGSRTAIPHGYTSCLVLPHVLRFNAGAATERLAELAAVVGAATSERPAVAAEEFVTALETLIDDLGLPRRLAAVNVTDPADLDAIARATLGEVAIVNNPRTVTEHDVREILERAR
ncbi:MAG: iron-containing alcohol dehydrogenase [Nocardioidaceae bacterium]|nr:iron-containing alcohol dehydrogenase [Nocardioidaceae bacterium]